MTAYVIAVREETTDPAQLEEYSRRSMASFEGRAFEARAAYGRIEVLEGDPAEGAVVIEFPSFEDAKAWYHSAANQQAMRYRKAGARYRMMIVDGI